MAVCTNDEPFRCLTRRTDDVIQTRLNNLGVKIMKLSFDSIEEGKLFVAGLKGTRGKKGEDGEAETGSAPQPLAPPVGGSVGNFVPGGGMSTTQFAPPAGGAVAGAFPAAAAPDPAIVALVSRIVTKLDSAIASG